MRRSRILQTIVPSSAVVKTGEHTSLRRGGRGEAGRGRESQTAVDAVKPALDSPPAPHVIAKVSTRVRFGFRNSTDPLLGVLGEVL